jgi:hypothetical protein
MGKGIHPLLSLLIINLQLLYLFGQLSPSPAGGDGRIVCINSHCSHLCELIFFITATCAAPHIGPTEHEVVRVQNQLEKVQIDLIEDANAARTAEEALACPLHSVHSIRERLLGSYRLLIDDKACGVPNLGTDDELRHPGEFMLLLRSTCMLWVQRKVAIYNQIVIRRNQNIPIGMRLIKIKQKRDRGSLRDYYPYKCKQ